MDPTVKSGFFGWTGWFAKGYYKYMDPNPIWLNLNEDPPREPFVLVYVFVLGASSIAGGGSLSRGRDYIL